MEFTPLQIFYWHCHSSIASICNWSNCDGRHLVVQLPTREWWDIDSRALNCSAPWDKQHRCWVRHGELPFITVNKDGFTCDAGGGSIKTVSNWHGFLRNGNWYEEPLIGKSDQIM